MALPKKEDVAKTQKTEKAGKTATMKKSPAAVKKDIVKPAAAKPKK